MIILIGLAFLIGEFIKSPEEKPKPIKPVVAKTDVKPKAEKPKKPEQPPKPEPKKEPQPKAAPAPPQKTDTGSKQPPPPPPSSADQEKKEAELRQKFNEELKNVQEQMEKAKTNFGKKIASLEDQLKARKGENTELKKTVQKARESDKKPDVKDTTSSNEIFDVLEKMLAGADKKYEEARKETKEKEENWAEFFNKSSKKPDAGSKDKAAKDETKEKEKEWTAFFKKLAEETEPSKESASPKNAADPLKEIQKAFKKQEDAKEKTVEVAEKNRDRISPGRGPKPSEKPKPVKPEPVKKPEPKPEPKPKIEPKTEPKPKQLDVKNPSEEAYNKAFKGLVSMGREKVEKPSVQWAIFNDPGKGLREVYSLFNLTPVIRTGRTYLDLATGDKVNEYKIESFAPTGILSEYPWRDFGDMLESVQKRTGRSLEDAEIVYFMSDQMLTYFLNKVQRAVNCATRKGLMSRDMMKSGQVRVVGRVLGINSPGGQNQFGLYVPMRIEVFDKDAGEVKDIHLDLASCFGNDPDIAPLMADGVL